MLRGLYNVDSCDCAPGAPNPESLRRFVAGKAHWHQFGCDRKVIRRRESTQFSGAFFDRSSRFQDRIPGPPSLSLTYPLSPLPSVSLAKTLNCLDNIFSFSLCVWKRVFIFPVVRPAFRPAVQPTACTQPSMDFWQCRRYSRGRASDFGCQLGSDSESCVAAVRRTGCMCRAASSSVPTEENRRPAASCSEHWPAAAFEVHWNFGTAARQLKPCGSVCLSLPDRRLLLVVLREPVGSAIARA